MLRRERSNLRVISGPEEKPKEAKKEPEVTLEFEGAETTKILHFWQKWYVGGTNPGKGVLVQTNTGQMYTDHGRHEDIVSPPAAAAPKKGKK